MQHIDRLPYSVSIYCCISGMCLFQSRRSLSLSFSILHTPSPSPIRAQIASPISREPFQFPPLSYDSLLFRGGYTRHLWQINNDDAHWLYSRYISGGASGESRESIACGIKKKSKKKEKFQLGRKKKKEKNCWRNSVSLFIRARRSSTLPSWSGKKLKKGKGRIFKYFPCFTGWKRQRRHGLYIKRILCPCRGKNIKREKAAILYMAVPPHISTDGSRAGSWETRGGGQCLSPTPVLLPTHTHTHTPVVCVCV